MRTLDGKLLEVLLDGSAEPLLVAEIDSPDWRVVLCNQALAAIVGTDSITGQPFADVIEKLLGRDLALEISEAVRSGEESSLPVEMAGREYLLVLRPVSPGGNRASRYFAAYWRGAAGSETAAGDSETHQALLKAKRRIRDLARDDPVTGLLNGNSFAEVLAHDWAVAARDRSALALVCFSLDDFAAYLEVFGRHATDSCLRRVAQAIRRCLRRASDVVARIEADKLIVLSHGSDEAAVNEFAETMAATIRELGLHHPHSKVSRFVTVSFRVAHKQAGKDKSGPTDFLNSVLES